MVVIKRPEICPYCGELVIAWHDEDSDLVLYPVHEDNVTPWVRCVASQKTARDGKIVKS